MALAIVGYLLIALFIAIGLVPESRGWLALGIGALASVLLASNGWGLRARIPVFRSSSKWLAGMGWAGLVVLILVAFAAIQPTTPGKGNQQVAQLTTTNSPTTAHSTEKSPAPTPSPAASQVPSPTPSPSPSLKPSPSPSPVASPTPTPPPAPPVRNTCGAPANPWGYNFCGGSLIYQPDADFCGYFNCIPSFWKSTNGYVDQCVDGTYSHSGGRQGACSHHGGEKRPLYT
jgi:hypothetical protein